MELSKIIEKNCGKLIYDCSDEELYIGLLKTVNELKREKKTEDTKKKLYYISAEFLIGKLLESNLINLGIYDEVKEILDEYDRDLSSIAEVENEPSLGNGGLGRLAACYMDSVAYCGMNGDGIGLLYHFGLFKQEFKDNKQTETINPWDCCNTAERTDVVYNVRFKNFELQSRLYTIDIVGKDRVNKLKLFDLETSDESIVKIGACGAEYDKNDIKKNLTLFLYPDDSDEAGRRLRLYQEYFMACSAAHLILEECERKGCKLYDIYDYAVIQINDTHPSLIIPELIRLLNARGIEMDTAIEAVRRTCAYTNHTILSEALEKWPRKTLEDIIPEIMDIIKELDKRVRSEFSDKSVYIIDENDMVNMAHMDIHYGFSVNGVASLHTKILKETELNNFYNIYPNKFNNKTNGISMRRWLIGANPKLTELIKSLIGDGFLDDYERLRELKKYADDATVLNRIAEIKSENKKSLCNYINSVSGAKLDENSVFDVQIKRLHEYKRQQMNVLYLINKYLDIKQGIYPPRPITAVFGAKAAGAYTTAKNIIHLILCMQNLLEKDHEAGEYLKIYMAENYNVSYAEKIIPAADISEQISLASKEASGTGNMKLMLNGAVTLGTRDGANIEIRSLVGDENIYIFGDLSDDVINRYKSGEYNPRDYYNNNEKIRLVVDFITSSELLEVGDRSNLESLKNELINKDYFMTFPDFDSYIKTKDKMLEDYCDRLAWARKTLINTAMSGYFSSDRAVKEYNEDIWRL